MANAWPVPVPLASESSGEIEVSERRAHPRITVGMRVVEVDGDTFYFQYATDLSESGLRLDGCLPRREGARVTLHFIPPGSRTRLVLLAEVVGNLAYPRYGTCLHFVDAEDSPARLWLRAYIHRRLAG